MPRNLIIHFIWNDSLLLGQREESLPEWKIRAPKMDTLYSHTAFNIAATGASDGSIQLFLPRDASTMKSREVCHNPSHQIQ